MNVIWLKNTKESIEKLLRAVRKFSKMADFECWKFIWRKIWTPFKEYIKEDLTTLKDISFLGKENSL